MNQESDSKSKWWVEKIIRPDKYLLIFFYGSEGRGQVELTDYQEVNVWEKLMEKLNSMSKS